MTGASEEERRRTARAEASGGTTCGSALRCSHGERRMGEGRAGGRGGSKGSGGMTCGPRAGDRGVGVLATLGSAALASGGRGTDLGGAVGRGVMGFALGGAAARVCTGLAATAKMSASWWMASICASPMAARGKAGVGLCRAQQRSMVARIAASADES
jgi:hypothetical protein